MLPKIPLNTGHMLEHAGWMLPAAKEAYAHREAALKGIGWLLNYLRSKNQSIAFTGHAGVGKTVLFDYLTEKAYSRDYKPPGESQDREKGAISATNKQIQLVTIPGQDSSPRLEAVDQLFNDRSTVDGVIHVVANGFVKLRSDVARQFFIDQGIDTVQKFRTVQMEAELKDLADTCKIVRESARRHHRPKWLLVAVTKADLYYPELMKAQMYYSPENAGSPFSAQLNELANQIGKDNFRWNSAPVCCWLEDFTWNRENVPSTLKPDDRDHYVANLVRTLQGIC